MKKITEIYRGGVTTTEPITKEVIYSGAPTTIKPGAVVVLQQPDGFATKAKITKDEMFYIAGISLFGGIEDSVSSGDSIARLYRPRSGDLFAVRATANVQLVDDMPLNVDSNGYAVKSNSDEALFFVDLPSNTSLKKDDAAVIPPTTSGQLIPVKIK